MEYQFNPRRRRARRPCPGTAGSSCSTSSCPGCLAPDANPGRAGGGGCHQKAAKLIPHYSFLFSSFFSPPPLFFSSSSFFFRSSYSLHAFFLSLFLSFFFLVLLFLFFFSFFTDQRIGGRGRNDRLVAGALGQAAGSSLQGGLTAAVRRGRGPRRHLGLEHQRA